MFISDGAKITELIKTDDYFLQKLSMLSEDTLYIWLYILIKYVLKKKRFCNVCIYYYPNIIWKNFHLRSRIRQLLQSFLFENIDSLNVLYHQQTPTKPTWLPNKTLKINTHFDKQSQMFETTMKLHHFFTPIGFYFHPSLHSPTPQSATPCVRWDRMNWKITYAIFIEAQLRRVIILLAIMV